MSDARTSVLFVADDLGVSAGTNAGIERAARAGVLGQASLCVTGAAVEAGVALARRLGIGVGLHLTLSLGHALTGPIPRLTDAAGRFRPLGEVLSACLLRRLDRAAVRREIDAQFARLRELVATPTHLNGHHHVHCFPVIRELAFAAARDCGIPWTRIPDEHPAGGARFRANRVLLSRLAAQARPAAAAHGLRWLPFVGLGCAGRLDFGARLLATATRLPAGDFEWMVHPRYPDETNRALDPAAADAAIAAAETDALADAALVRRLAALGARVVDCFPAVAGGDGRERLALVEDRLRS